MIFGRGCRSCSCNNYEKIQTVVAKGWKETVKDFNIYFRHWSQPASDTVPLLLMLTAVCWQSWGVSCSHTARGDAASQKGPWKHRTSTNTWEAEQKKKKKHSESVHLRHVANFPTHWLTHVIGSGNTKLHNIGGCFLINGPSAFDLGMRPLLIRNFSN